jgi:hypothetical protein
VPYQGTHNNAAERSLRGGEVARKNYLFAGSDAGMLAGVELSSVLTARRLLISGTATTAKKAPLPDPLYVYCTKIFFDLAFSDAHVVHSIPKIRRDGLRKHERISPHMF